MPLYEYACLDCGREYDTLAAYDPEGVYPGVTCPGCHSDQKRKQMSRCSFAFANPVGTDRYVNSHDYRYKHKAPAVQKERAAAEAASHVGASPYNPIDDITSGKHFGDDFG